jgi:hypothetical protein
VLAIRLFRPFNAELCGGVIRHHRKKITSAWRLFNPGQQALLVLVHLELGAGLGVSTPFLLRTARVAPTAGA